MIKEAKLSNKCQITIPKFVRDVLHIDKGDEVIFYIEDNEIKLTSANNVKINTVNKTQHAIVRKGDKK